MQRLVTIICIFLFGFSTFIKAQNAIDVERLFSLYPNQQLIYLNRQENIDIKTEKNLLSVISHNSEKMLLLKKGLSNVRSKKIYTSEFVKVKNLRVYLYVYNGKKHSRKELNSIELKSEHSDENGIFYDNAQFYNITFYDANEGDIIEIEYDQEWIEPRFFGSLYFSDYYPVLQTKYNITCQNDIILNSKEFNNQNLPYKYTKIPGSKKSILTWEIDTIKPIVDEDYDPSFKKKASYINFSIESYQKNGETIPVCGSLKNLYKWYNELLKDVDISNDEYLVKLCDSLTNGVDNPEEKIKRIFYWVQEKIAYLAYEDGLGGYVPREAVLVAKRRFGDCKDMANLITRLGQIAKLPVYRTWIGTRDIPFQFSEFPAPYCANHMIATYLGEKDTIFLDATGRFYPFGMPTSMIQGKEGLIGISETEFILKKVPVQETKINMEHDSIVLSLADGNKVTGRGFYKLYGYEKISLMHLFGNKSYKWQKEYLQSLLEKGNNKFSLDTFDIVDQDIDKPLLLNYVFTINDYITENNNSKYINLNFLKTYFDKFTLTKRNYPFSFTNNNVTKLSVTFNIGNYTIDYLPPDTNYSDSVFDYSLKYSKLEKSILFENTISIHKIEIPKGDFSQVNEAINSYKKAKSNLVALSIKK